MSWIPDLTPIDGGYRVTETETHYIDVMRMMFNWRLCATPKALPFVFDAGYCYIGTGPDTFAKAVLAGIEWAKGDPLSDDPIGWDKDALRNRYSDAYLARERARKSLVSDDQLPGRRPDQVRPASRRVAR
jgi:hypothetical protein